MKVNSRSKNCVARVVRRAGVFTALALAAACAAAQTYNLNVLYQFPSGTTPVGSSPLLRDTFGNLFGVTNNGGANGYGSVYELVNNNGSYSETTLYSFTNGSDGGGTNPSAGVTMDGAGNLYGTTQYGGAYGKGTAWELQNVYGASNLVLLHSFGAPNDGAVPDSTLAIDSAGNLYGTTANGGGSSATGTVFELAFVTPGNFTYSLLHSFMGTDGVNPTGVVIGPGNLLYGICRFGGPGYIPPTPGVSTPPSGYGTVYLMPEGGFGSATVPAPSIYSFTGGSDGTNPIGPPTVDAQGDVFVATSGTTSSGVSVSGGSVIELVNSSSGYVEKTLYSFPLPSNNPSGDASEPDISLTLDAYGNIFGTTSFGGAYGEESDPPGGYGTIFELVNNAGSYQEGVLYSAPGNGNGIRPGELLMDQNGNFYGIFGRTSFTVGVGGQGPTEVWQLAVQPATTGVTLTASPNPAFFGDDVTLTAAVTANPAPAAFLPGTVTFSEGSTVLGTGFGANGTVSITIPSNLLGAGADTITAQFTPSALAVTGNSGTTVETVNTDSDIAVLSGNNAFNGNQTVSGSVAAASFIGGTFTGNGAGLTNVTAASFTGTILDSQVTGLSTDLTNAEALAAAEAEASLGTSFVPLAGGTMSGALNLPSVTATGAIQGNSVAATGSLSIGGGTPITQYVSVTLPVALPAINTGECTMFETAALTGFTPGANDTLSLGIPGSLLTGLGPVHGHGPGHAPNHGPMTFLTYQAWETSSSASTTLSLQVCNSSIAYPGGDSGTIRFDVFKH